MTVGTILLQNQTEIWYTHLKILYSWFRTILPLFYHLLFMYRFIYLISVINIDICFRIFSIPSSNSHSFASLHTDGLAAAGAFQHAQCICTLNFILTACNKAYNAAYISTWHRISNTYMLFIEVWFPISYFTIPYKILWFKGKAI